MKPNDGYEIKLSERELRQLVEYRRDRDILAAQAAARSRRRERRVVEGETGDEKKDEAERIEGAAIGEERGGSGEAKRRCRRKSPTSRRQVSDSRQRTVQGGRKRQRPTPARATSEAGLSSSIDSCKRRSST